MKALTIIQPWATLIAVGAKRYETRSWETYYRGPIAIHAGRTWNRSLAGLIGKEPFRGALEEAGYRGLGLHWYGPRGSVRNYGLPFGAIVAVGVLRDCLPTSKDKPWAGGLSWQRHPWVTRLDPREIAFGDFTADRFGWLITDVQKLDEPVMINGCKGLWDVPKDIIARLPRLEPARRP